MSCNDARFEGFRTGRPLVDRIFLREYLNEKIRWPQGRCVSDVMVQRLFLPGGKHPRIEVEYELTLAGDDSTGTRIPLYARHPALPRIVDPCTTPSEKEPAGILFTDAQLNTTFQTSDCDPDLAQMSACLDSAFMSHKLAERVGPTAPDCELRCRLMSYRRGRRFVVRYWYPARGSRGWIGKAFADGRGAALARCQKALARQLAAMTGDTVRVPKVLGYDEELRMLLTKWSGRAPNRHANWPAELWATCAGGALAAIHRAKLDLPSFERDHDWEILQRWHAALHFMQPPCKQGPWTLAEHADKWLALLAAAHDRLTPIEVCVTHGDFYESQILVNRGRIVVLDLDTLALADRSIDLGNYLAHQWLWCIERGVAVDRYRRIVSALLDSYEAAAGPVDEARLVFHWAACLFRVGAVHAFRDTTARATGPLWQLIEPVLRRGRRAVEDFTAHVPAGIPGGSHA